MFDKEALSAALTGLAVASVHEADGVADAPDALIGRAAARLGFRGCSVCLETEGRLTCVLATDEHLAELERVQARTRRGPGTVAYRERRPVPVTDVRREQQRWPEYAAAAAAGRAPQVAGVFAAPLLRGGCIGVLLLFAAAPRHWTVDDYTVVRLLTGATVTYVDVATRLRREGRITEQLQHAFESRVLIEQAKGVIAQANGITPAQAFTLIRQHARSERTSLQRISREIAEGKLRV